MVIMKSSVVSVFVRNYTAEGQIIPAQFKMVSMRS